MADKDTRIPSLELNAELVGTRRCFDAWREAVREIYCVEPLFEGQSDRERVHGWLLDGLIFSEVAFSPQFFRHETHHVQNTNYLSLQIYKEGRTRGIIDGSYFDVSPGDVHIFDFSRAFRSTTEASVVAGVVIPHEAVGYDPRYHPAHMTFGGRTPAGRFLMRSFFTLQELLPSVRSDEAALLADGFCGLLRRFIAPDDSEGPASRASRLERSAEIKSYMDRHLADPGLSANRICREFNVSRSSLYRDFAPVGGVGQYISQRRLERTLNHLLSTPPSRGRVQEIAARWGYEDPGHFSRVFRQRFGVPPSQISGGTQGETMPHHGHWAGDGQADSGANLGVWLKSL